MNKLIDDRLKEMGIELIEVPRPLGSYKPCIRHSDMLFISGQLPVKDGSLAYTGKLGADLTVDQGKDAARLAAINCLSVLKSELGDLEKVGRILKVTGYISSADGFGGQAEVLNGASDLFSDVFGEKGVHARVAVGVYELPKGSPVEIELIAVTEDKYTY